MCVLFSQFALSSVGISLWNALLPSFFVPSLLPREHCQPTLLGLSLNILSQRLLSLFPCSKFPEYLEVLSNT